MLRLGESIERFGAIPETKLAETANCVAGFVKQARRLGVGRLEVLVTSPGRQAENGDELLNRLAASSGVPVRLLSSVEEGRLAFVGAARATRGTPRRLIAVCDVGGGSAQIAVGTRRDGPAWVRSIDIGSMRLTSRLLNDDPPGDVAIQAARVEVDRLLAGVVPPLPETALAVGGSARALRSLLGAKLGSRSSTKRPSSSRAPRRGRSSSSTASTRSACARSPPARSSSARSASGSASFRCASCAAGCERARPASLRARVRRPSARDASRRAGARGAPVPGRPAPAR